MRKYTIGFGNFIAQIKKDAMLAAALLAPVLAGFFIRFGIPYLEEKLTHLLQKDHLLSPYYYMFDVLLGVLAPLMVSFIGAMVILGETDDTITKYMSVTPLGKNGYLITRFLIPAIIAFLMSMGTMALFSLAIQDFWKMVGICFLASLMGVGIGLFMIACSTNKVEGMAMGKLSGLFILGVFIPPFVTENVQYLASVLPSFWLGKFVVEDSVLMLGTGIIISLVWISFFYKKFEQKSF